jgi:hypothetical protein
MYCPCIRSGCGEATASAARLGQEIVLCPLQRHCRALVPGRIGKNRRQREKRAKSGSDLQTTKRRYPSMAERHSSCFVGAASDLRQKLFVSARNSA